MTAAMCVTAALLLPGCTLFHHEHRDEVGCHQAPFSGNAQTLPPLKVPPGLSAPNISNGVKIPALDAPAVSRSQDAPCLDFPPKYVPETPTPPVRRGPQPVE